MEQVKSTVGASLFFPLLPGGLARAGDPFRPGGSGQDGRQDVTKQAGHVKKLR